MKCEIVFSITNNLLLLIVSKTLSNTYNIMEKKSHFKKLLLFLVFYTYAVKIYMNHPKIEIQ